MFNYPIYLLVGLEDSPIVYFLGITLETTISIFHL